LYVDILYIIKKRTGRAVGYVAVVIHTLLRQRPSTTLTRFIMACTCYVLKPLRFITSVLFVAGMILILIFAEVLGLYGLITALVLIVKAPA